MKAPSLRLRALTVGLAVVASLALAETALRVFGKSTVAPFFAELEGAKKAAEEALSGRSGDIFQRLCVRHPLYGFTMRPGLSGSPFGWALETDRAGFRNAADLDLAALPKKDLVIGLFGGSGAFGWKVDGNAATIAAQLEALLNKGRSRGRVRVVNLAIPAWHQPQQFFLFSRFLQHLDGVITLDGVNEVWMPLFNSLETERPVPPDFPWVRAYVGLYRAGDVVGDSAMHSLLSYERDYAPASWAAKSRLYVLARGLRTRRMRERTLRLVQTDDDGSRRDPIAEPTFARDVGLTERIVDYGIGDWFKYSRMMDELASAAGIPVLHAVQPLNYSFDRESAEPDKGLPPEIALALDREHLLLYHSRLRTRLGRWTKSAPRRGGVWYVDLGQALGAGGQNWLDIVHPAAVGCRIVAERLGAVLAGSDFLDRAAARSGAAP